MLTEVFNDLTELEKMTKILKIASNEKKLIMTANQSSDNKLHINYNKVTTRLFVIHVVESN